MQTNIADFIKDTPEGLEADAILRKCVHCGFCLATCPTYGVLGDELDSPRGRIYLMKQVLEGAPASEKTQHHLDRCLTCRACETTCPSGVQYGRLVDIGREVVEQQVGRPWFTRLQRFFLRKGLANSSLFAVSLALGRLFRPLLPSAMAAKIPLARPQGVWPQSGHARRMLVLQGCVQPALAPDINAATARVLDRLGISLITAASAGCCGAVSHHLNAQEEARALARQNIDAWWPQIEAGAEAIVVTASGCGTMVKEYGHLLAADERYAKRAERVSELSCDPTEVLLRLEGELTKFAPQLLDANIRTGRVAFHSPCSLQHGLKITGAAERLLKLVGYSITSVRDAHLCCGSAGTYSLLQPEISKQLLENKMEALQADAPDVIATANIGCLTHLDSAAALPVRHWIELLDERLAPPGASQERA